MTHIILSGAGGQLGKAFQHQLSFEKGYSVYAFDKGQLDISDKDKIHHLLDTLPQTKFWINCAAYTKVDEAEAHMEEAMLYNATAPGYIAEACQLRGVHMVHFSSDYVYHNGQRIPIKETDPTEPKSVYAKSKLFGEEIIQESGVSHTILRTSWVYGPDGHNFVNTMLRLGKIKERLHVVGDQAGAPTYTMDIVKCCMDLMLTLGKDLPSAQGIFNFANSGEITWDNFARTIFKLSQLPCEVTTITSADYGALAPRPHYSVLNCDKIQSRLSYRIPDWEDALIRYLTSISA